jgi:5-methyltetrahydropteroyltriglutamate--homocysteine methyltransferase
MPIPTEPIGSIPRPTQLIEAVTALVEGHVSEKEVNKMYVAPSGHHQCFRATGSPVITDGEQTKPSFATHPLHGLDGSPDGVVIPFADGHQRQLPKLTAGPFRFKTR